MDKSLSLGFYPNHALERYADERENLLRYLNLKLAANGLPIAPEAGGIELVELASGLLTNFREKTRLLETYRCPADARIERFLNDHFAEVRGDTRLRVPARALVLDRHGLARELSIPATGARHLSDYMDSYRVHNGVLHNPRADRRTTQGTFHIVEGGLPIPADKRAVPRGTFVELLRRALSPPQPVLELPFTAQQTDHAACWASILLRPTVCPEVVGFCPRMSMEVRFFAPGSLVANLDFVESIFGNAGDPYVPANDAGLDVEHWTGHTGCVILAPHLTNTTKKEVGLPHISQATERQIQDRMCWEAEDELYNDGGAYKVTCRSDDGVIVTVITDSYFGYCKKEVKTQISYAANLMGEAEEEHAGGALVFPSWSLGDSFQVNSKRFNGRTFEDVVRDYGSEIDVRPEGYAVDRNFPELVYIPESARADLRDQEVSWEVDGERRAIPLLPDQVYMAPSGYKIRMEKHPSAPSWRLIGTAGEGVFCHKPCTVSGGGKSEISKSLRDYMQYGPVFVADFEKDFQQIREILARDFSNRWNAAAATKQQYGEYPSRPLLSQRRSLGSVIKLLTPSEEYTEEYNAWLQSIPNHVLAQIFIIKRFYQPEWGDDWESHFSVDLVNGMSGHELTLHNRKLVGSYLRVGFNPMGLWRLYKLRQDFAAAAKVQTEDDISASVVVPSRALNYLAEGREAISHKFVVNCEYRLFQRPDDAIHRGFDKQAEADLARPGVNFISNFEPLPREVAEQMMEKVVDFDAFTKPMKMLLRSLRRSESQYVVCSDNPRRVGGVPTKNPRYLQDRPDLVRPLDRYVAEVGTRFFRCIPASHPVHLPVGAVLSGRRNNPPDKQKGIRGLAVYSPIHYQELPELFMDYVSSLTGKSPSTTGAGSEGALTKGPFNNLRTSADLNAAFVSMVLTQFGGFSTAAGHVGPNGRFDHDLSLLVPEIWTRMTVQERDPEYLVQEGLLERLEDFEHNGEVILASRLGYRITRSFVRRFFGRVFDHPNKVFDEAILRPEEQDLDAFADGVKYICEAHERVARRYFEDGTVDLLCPPLKALIAIMAEGSYQGKSAKDEEVRSLFSTEAVLESDWYQERLVTRQRREVALWQRHESYLAEYPMERRGSDPSLDQMVRDRQSQVRRRLEELQQESHLKSLYGTIGAQPNF